MLLFSLTLPVFVVLVGLLFLLMPGLTRPDVFFSVTVAPEFRLTDEGRRAVRTYRVVSVLSSLASLAAVGAVARSAEPSPWVALALAPQLLGAAVGFLLARHRVMPHAVPSTPMREAVLAPHRGKLPGGWPLQVVPFVLLAAVAVVLAVRWQDLPARFPVHWGFSGQPDRWADHTLAGVFAPVVLAAAMCGLMLGVAVGLLHARRVRASGNEARREGLFRRLIVLALWAGEMVIALTTCRVALLALLARDALDRAFTASVAVVVAAMIVLVVLMIRLGQGGARLQPSPGDGEPVGDRTPDSAWKLGMFYVNRGDPSLFVEKRFGVGYTFNFANPVAWLLLALLLGVPILVAIVAH